MVTLLENTKIRAALRDTASANAQHHGSRMSSAELYFAAWKGDREEVRRLLDDGANTNWVNGSEGGRTPLHAASDEGHSSIAQLLLANGANIGARTKAGWTPLHHACRYSHTEVVRVLMEASADVNAQDEMGRTPAYIAAEWNQSSALQLLQGAEFNRQTQFGWTPLHVACKYGHVSAVQTLLAAGAKRDTVTLDGHTPRRVAETANHKDVVTLIDNWDEAQVQRSAAPVPMPRPTQPPRPTEAPKAPSPDPAPVTVADVKGQGRVLGRGPSKEEREEAERMWRERQQAEDARREKAERQRLALEAAERRMAAQAPQSKNRFSGSNPPTTQNKTQMQRQKSQSALSEAALSDDRGMMPYISSSRSDGGLNFDRTISEPSYSAGRGGLDPAEEEATRREVQRLALQAAESRAKISTQRGGVQNEHPTRKLSATRSSSGHVLFNPTPLDKISGQRNSDVPISPRANSEPLIAQYADEGGQGGGLGGSSRTSTGTKRISTSRTAALFDDDHSPVPIGRSSPVYAQTSPDLPAGNVTRSVGTARGTYEAQKVETQPARQENPRSRLEILKEKMGTNRETPVVFNQNTPSSAASRSTAEAVASRNTPYGDGAMSLDRSAPPQPAPRPISSVGRVQSSNNGVADVQSNMGGSVLAPWQTKPMRTWTTDDVGLWLKALGMREATVECFRDNEVDGELLEHLEEEVMKTEFGLNWGQRTRVLKAIKQAKDEQAAGRIVSGQP